MRAPGMIDYVELPARDMDATEAFFKAVFGWHFESYGADYVAFSGSGVDGGFYRSDKVATVANGSALVVIYSADLEATQTMIEEIGGHIVRDTFSFPGGRRFHFADPSGNEWAVWSDQAE